MKISKFMTKSQRINEALRMIVKMMAFRGYTSPEAFDTPAKKYGLPVAELVATYEAITSAGEDVGKSPFKIFVITAGDCISEYSATSADDALEQYAHDAGKKSYTQLAYEWGQADSVYVLDTDAIINAVPHKVYDDFFGDGVAVIHTYSYEMWYDVCQEYAIDYSDYLTPVPFKYKTHRHA